MWNQPDPRWLDMQTPATLAYIIRFMRPRILQKFGRHKLANDGTPFGFGQAIVTPSIIRAELIAAYSELITQAIVENMDAFKAYLIVEREPTTQPHQRPVAARPHQPAAHLRHAGRVPPATPAAFTTAAAARATASSFGLS